MKILKWSYRLTFGLLILSGCYEKSVNPTVDPDSRIILAYQKTNKIWLLYDDFQSICITKDFDDLIYHAQNARFSPSGSKIVFTVNYQNQDIANPEGENNDIFLYDVISKLITRLTDNNLIEYKSQFLPNSNEIIYFEMEADTIIGKINAVNIYNGSTRTIVNSVQYLWNYPSVSIDGSKITFVNPVNGSYEIFLVNSDGTDLIQITNNDFEDSSPIFSPDGKYIYYSEFESEFHPVIIKYTISTATKIKLTTQGQAVYGPIISNNGELILCSYFDSSRIWVCLIDSSGSHLRIIDEGKNAGFTHDNSRIIYFNSFGIFEYNISDSTNKKIFEVDPTISSIQVNSAYK